MRRPGCVGSRSIWAHLQVVVANEAGYGILEVRGSECTFDTRAEKVLRCREVRFPRGVDPSRTSAAVHGSLYIMAAETALTIPDLGEVNLYSHSHSAAVIFSRLNTVGARVLQRSPPPVSQTSLTLRVEARTA